MISIRDFLPPVILAGFDRVARSFVASAAAWKRGDDMVDGPATRLTAPYAQSSWVFAAINLVSGEFTGLPVKFYEGDREYTDPAYDAWWAAPAIGADKKRINRADVDQLLALWLQAEGEAFILLDDSWMVTAGRKPSGFSPFIIARPDRVRLVVQGGELQGYVWTDAAGKQIPLVPEQVIHLKEANPYDDWRGLGRMQVASVPTEGAFLTGVYIRDLMRNNGDQGFIVIGKNGVANEDQRNQIVADLRAKRAALRRGIAKDLFLTGDITVERKKEDAASVDLTNTKALSHQEIFITFGVPPSMAGIKASYSIGKDSDRYQLITGRSQPLSKQITGGYATLGSRMTGRQLTAEHEWDEHPVMQEVRNSRIDTALKLWAAGWSWMVINEYLDLGMRPFPGWDIAYLPFSVSPVTTGAPAKDENPVVDPTLAEGKATPDLPQVAALRLLLSTRARTLPPGQRPEHGRNERLGHVQAAAVEGEALAAFTCGCQTRDHLKLCQLNYTVQKAERDPKEIARWKQHMATRRETVKAFVSAFGRVLMAARIETLRKIEAGAGKAVATKAAAADFMFDQAKFADAFQVAMRNQHTAALDKAAQQLFKELGKDDPFHFAPHDVLGFLGDRRTKLANVPQNVADTIRSSIQQGIDAGETQAQLSGRVKAEFNSLGDIEANRIGQTETSAAYGYGRQEAMVKAGVEFKAWLTSGNANVREAHIVAGATYTYDAGIPVDQPFIVDGEELMFPGDSSGSPGNVINCHCISIAVEKPEAAA